MPKIPAPTMAHLADLVADVSSRLAHNLLSLTARLQIAGARAGDGLAELHLYVDGTPFRRPITPRMPPPMLLALAAGMQLALDVQQGLEPSPAIFDRLYECLESPPAAADTLATFGYPVGGAAGLSLVAEEMYALRVALHQADPERWGELVARTDHPANERAAAAGVDQRRQRRRGGLTGLGYPEAPEGERLMLAALRELRAAFAAQRETTLGRTVWRALWSEQEIPTLEDLDGKPS